MEESGENVLIAAKEGENSRHNYTGRILIRRTYSKRINVGQNLAPPLSCVSNPEKPCNVTNTGNEKLITESQNIIPSNEEQSKTNLNESIIVTKRNVRSQPKLDNRINGIHMPYKGELLGRCRLKGCNRRTTTICANAGCGMRLCLNATEKVYIDQKPDDCPIAKEIFIRQLKREQKSCFITYHNMAMPTIT